MKEIDVIMGMLDWNNSAEEQAAGLAQAAQVENFQVFLQPCTEHYNKNVWDNCAKALAMRSDAELDACLENLLAWLRDMNWPGAFLILERLQAFQNSAALHRAIAGSLLCAQALGDEVWEENLRKLQNCENTISTQDERRPHMREVDLELDFCPKCEPEETQDPFPAQEHCFFNSFATVVQCTKCGTRYVPSPKSGVIITLNCCLWFWVSFYLSNSWHSPVATIVLFLLAFLQYAFVEILLRRFGTWRPFSENKPLEQQEYLLPTIIWSMLTALGLSLLMFAVTALMR